MNPLTAMPSAAINLTDRVRGVADKAGSVLTDSFSIINNNLPTVVTATVPAVVDQVPALADRLPEAIRPPRARWSGYNTAEALTAALRELATPATLEQIHELLELQGRTEKVDQVEVALQLLVYKKVAVKAGPTLWAAAPTS